MPVSLTVAEWMTFGSGVLLAVLLALIGYLAWKRSRIPPEERERARRAHLVARGKVLDATLVEARESLLFYSYDVRGIEYTASQDVSLLGTYLPVDLPVGMPVLVRYDPRNPANSILVAEGWTGLRVTKAG